MLAAINGVILLGAGVVVATLLAFPDLHLPTSGLDPSWQFAAEMAYRKGLVFGRDFSFTSGPLSFVYTRLFAVDTFGWSAFAFVYAVAVYLASIWWSAVRWSGLVCLSLLTITVAPLYQDVLFFSLSLMVFLLALSDRAPRAVMAALAVGLAVPCLAKFNIFVIALPLLGLADVAALVRKRRFYALTPIWIIAIVAFYVMAGQPISALGEFLIASLDVANGYGQTMGNFWWTSHQTAIVVISLAILASAAAAMRSNPDRLQKLAALIGLAWYLFLVFKSGNVRSGHQFITWGAMAAASCLFFMLPVTSAIVRRWIPVASGAIAVICLLLFQFFISELDAAHIARKRLAQLTSQMAAVTAWRSPVVRFDALATLRKSAEQQLGQNAPANLVGSVGVVPWDFSEVIAGGYNFDPQPSLQQYSSYTPRIRRLDLEHFADDRRPDNLIFRLATIDDRYRTVEIGPSLPHILAGYDYSGGHAGALPGSPLVLSRRKTARKIETTALGEIATSMDSWTPVPDLRDGAAFVGIHFHERLRGKLYAFLYKQSSFELQLKFANGEQTTSRVFPSLVSDGFMVLPPEVSEADLFSEMTAIPPQRPRNPLIAIRIHPMDLAASGFAADLTVSVASVTVRGEAEHPELKLDPMALLATGRVLKTTGFRMVDTDTLLAHSPTTIAVRLAAGKRLSGRFGVFDGAWQQGSPAPVTFKISTVEAGSRRVIFEQTLDPTNQTSDRGAHSFSIDLPEQGLPSGGVDIEFETGPGSSWGWSYWSKLNYAPTPSN